MTYRSKVWLLSATALAFVGAGSASAQEAPPHSSGPATAPQPAPAEQSSTPPPADEPQASAPDSASGHDIVVTGSRIARSGFTAPTPTTVVGAGDIQRTGASNVASVLSTLPEFRATASSQTSTFLKDSGANYLDLRGLGIARTLTLVDGQRYVPNNITGQVDVNMIPSILIDRIEVVTGGASAAYGSDAVAGVVNLIYKKNFEGLQGQVQGGISQYGDNREVNVGLLFGHNFANDRVHITVAGEYVDNGGGKSYDSRDWGRTNFLLFPNPNYAPGNGQPTRLFVGNVRQSNTTLGGLILSPGTLKGTQFDSNGNAIPFVFGNPVGPQNMVGGSGNVLSPYQLLKTPVERLSLNARFVYDITPDIHGGLQLSYAQDHVTSRGGTANDTNLSISINNPFMPPAIRSALQAAGQTSLTMGRQNSDISLDRNAPWWGVDNKGSVYRAVLSFDGKIGGNWSWNTYYEHGESEHLETQVGNRINANWQRAINVVTDPSSGQPVCAATLSADPAVRAAATGCVPYNVFGYYVRSDAAAAYVTGTIRNDIELSEDVISGSAQGNLFNTWAGPVSLAFGGEYRVDRANSTVDPLSAVNAFQAGNPKAINGLYNVKEAFVETVVPLAKNLPMLRLLEFNGAARIASYNLSGTVWSWKIGANYKPFDDLRFRFTESRDVRAPNLNELFSTALSTLNTVIDPLHNTSTTVTVVSGGNPNLTPEVSHTITGGVVYEPSWFSGLRLSVDAYDISIKNVISTLNPQDTVNRCAAGETGLCAAVQRDGSGTLIRISQQFQNFAKLSTRGIDFELLYRKRIATSGYITLRGLATYVDKLVTSDGVTAINVAGETGGLRVGDVPHWSSTVVLSYDNPRFAFSAQAHYIGSGKLDALGTPATLNTNFVASRTYVQLSGSYTIVPGDKGPKVQVYGVIDNLFDTDPPPGAGTTWIQTNAALFDVIGRSFTAGVRFRF